MEDAHARAPQDVLSFFGTDAGVGLSEHQVSQARAQYGRNELPHEQGVLMQGGWAEWGALKGTGGAVWRGGSSCNSTRVRRSAPPPHAFCAAGTPLWKLILKQFDDLLVKVRVRL
jgi:hypothetical protein